MPSTSEQVGIILSELSEMFKEELSQGRISGYIEVLKHYSYEDLQYAVREITRERSSHWFPLPKEITKIIHADRKPTYKALSEPEPTPEDHERGKYACQFAVWLMGSRKAGATKVPACPGVWHTKSFFKHDGKSRWREAVNPIRRAELWLQFLTEQKAPDWLIDEAKADMPVEV